MHSSNPSSILRETAMIPSLYQVWGVGVSSLPIGALCVCVWVCVCVCGCVWVWVCVVSIEKEGMVGVNV